jgi:hypothetical protein
MFRKYMHVERFGNDEVQGIELGGCYIFPKIDGTNGSIWYDNAIMCGSRKRELSVNDDNAGFCNWALSDDRVSDFFIGRKSNKMLRLYGEWLVPHSIKNYREDAWKRFYVFDVFNDQLDKYLSYDEYQPILEECGLDYVIPLCVMNNATYDNLIVELEQNFFLMQEGKGFGEGIVIKNYNYQNKFGRTVWAKIVANEFKEKHVKMMGATIKNMKELPENIICQDYVSKALVDKTYAKIAAECEGWNSKYIPRLFGMVWYDLINEEIWNILKKMKNPVIDFQKLYHLTVLRIKELKSELF